VIGEPAKREDVAFEGEQVGEECIGGLSQRLFLGAFDLVLCSPSR
jgi:hypothetical protein